MDVARGLKGDPYQEFRKGEGLEGLQASARGGAFTATSVLDVSVRNHQPPPVPSISGGFTFRKLSDIQEVRRFFSFLSLLSKATAPTRRGVFCWHIWGISSVSDTGGAHAVSGAKLVCKSTQEQGPPPLLIRRQCHFCASITAKSLSHTSEGACKSHHSSK